MKINDFTFYSFPKPLYVDGFYSMFERKISKEYVFAGEMHDFWECLFVISGNLRVSGDDRVYNLKENEIIFHKPNELHKFHVDSGANIFVMSFNLKGKLTERFRNLTVRLTQSQIDQLYRIIIPLRKAATTISCLDNSYIDELPRDDVLFYETVLRTELFLLSLCKDSLPVSDYPSNFETDIFKKAIQVLDENVYGWISIEQIAHKLNISMSYLKKIFSKYAGLGIHKYLLKIKIAKAGQLLQAGKSVSMVSETLSFSSYNYFSIAFKRETGKTPSQYKSQISTVE